MRVENKKQIKDIAITTTEKITYTYFGTEWEYLQYNKEFVYIKFVEAHPTDCIIYNKDQVISIEIG